MMVGMRRALPFSASGERSEGSRDREGWRYRKVLKSGNIAKGSLERFTE